MSYAAQLTNHTPFAAEKFVLIDGDGQEQVLVVVAGTFDADGGRPLDISSVQPAPLVEDIYQGEPSASSLLAENELSLEKPYVDVIVNGTAHAPHGHPVERVSVGMVVGSIRKALWVTGDRTRESRSARDAEPFVRMPILYERAYGGARPDGVAFPYNPVGIGFGANADATFATQTEVPNIEYPNEELGLADSTTPAGFGAIARWWQPRVGLAGTYDAEWQQNRWPLLPKDFDTRFNQAAPADQRLPAVRGHEPVRLVNLTPDGSWEFRLPRLDIPVHLLYDRRRVTAAMKVDTVVIEPDQRRLRMTARLSVRTLRNGDNLRQVVLGQVTRGWLTAVAKRKNYLDGAKRGGADRTGRAFVL